MQWPNEIARYLSLLDNNQEQIPLQKIVSLLDLTSLNVEDTEVSIANLFEKARTPYGHVAAVCVYPQFVRMGHAQFDGNNIKVATVANFPEGSGTLISVLAEISRALQNGADEIDLVFPYANFLAGNIKESSSFIESCKAACGEQILLKVILETGMMQNLDIITAATRLVVESGADFVKTSTGKVHIGATKEAAAVILLNIRELSSSLKKPVGFKAAGGIRSIKEASDYIKLAAAIMGDSWLKPEHFRIGTSKVIDDILKS